MANQLVAQGYIADTFTSLSIFGADILSIDANIVNNYSFDVPAAWRYTQPAVIVDNATFCNVTVTYTHPGQDDIINAEVWLPPEDSWNGRLQANGGGGWVAGRFILAYVGMAGAIFDGYATASTDAGVTTDSFNTPTWTLTSPGNLHLVNLDNFGQRSLGDLAVISKKVIESYYGRPAEYSYWNGCSNGGRQASILAQQYPDAYDGIIAAAPASYWAELAMNSVWPVFFMDSTKQYPRNCELNQITSLAVAKCDDLDGIRDGLIANPEACRANFNAWDYVGTAFRCVDTGSNMKISTAAASVAEASWDGPKFSNGDFLWYGHEIGANLSAIAGTTCSNNGTCVPTARSTATFWYLQFVRKDPTADLTILSPAQFDELYLTLKRIFSASVEASEARIAKFYDLGGKMITYHGLADPTITPQSTLHYYEEVSRLFPNVTDFYRYYRVPGLEHCFGGNGGQPVHLFDQLRQWVENGTSPDASPVVIQLPTNGTMDQVVCPWPKEAVLKRHCSNMTWPLDCWSCR
ncbi:tannase and feruloyl esterase [Xylaria arbuscula]|nr:tannase and feruloyl esterase [Xylaria arbuscula]